MRPEARQKTFVEHLERLIQSTSPRSDSRQLAQDLLMTHCSMNTIYESLPDDLLRTKGMTAAAANMIGLIPQLARYCLREDARAYGVLRDYKQAGAFLKSLFVGMHIECFYMICLDKDGAVIDCPLIQRGTVDETPFYTRLLLEHAIRLDAHAIVLSHNHPSGQLLPSESDLNATIHTIRDLKPLGIRVLDHILVADNRFASFRARHMITESLFLSQDPNDKLLSGWLKPQKQTGGNKMKALILAAGYSTRLYPLTRNTPKALLPVGKQLMLDYLVSELATIPAIEDIYIVTNDKFHKAFEDYAKDAESRYHRRFTVVNDGTLSDDTKLGAVGDIQFAIDKLGIDDDLMICASDNFFTFPLIEYYRFFEETDCDTLLGAHIPSITDLRRFAVAKLDETGRVTELIEKPQDPPSDIAIYALYIYKKATLPLFKTYLDEGGAPDAPGHFPEWLCKRQDVRVYLFKGECIDIGTPDSYKEICARFQ